MWNDLSSDLKELSLSYGQVRCSLKTFLCEASVQCDLVDNWALELLIFTYLLK